MNETLEKIGAHEVAAWLRRHPTFLKQFPDLALTLVVPRDDGPTASLASYQLEVLRDKNRELSRRLAELGANAQVNERLAVRTHQLTLALMRQGSAADTLRAMAASLEEDFAGDLVRIVSLQPWRLFQFRHRNWNRRHGCRSSPPATRGWRRSTTACRMASRSAAACSWRRTRCCMASGSAR